MQRPHVLQALALALCFLGVSAPSAAEDPLVERVVVNRIVAVIDHDVVTLVELKRRAEPFKKRLAEVPPDKRAAAEAQLHKDLVQTAIDERLIARDARARKVTVSPAEIDSTIDKIAAAQGITRARVLEVIVEQGFTQEQYREQIVRQLLVGKLMRIRMSDKFQSLDKDPEKASKQLEKMEKSYLSSLRANVYVEVRL
ncbi:MAG: SurA N-terminal domain-containing protein [Polyangiaceae bacterium]|nr:SurA N-terminal domain-containing protein [Polyangiaceae bacterium]